MPKDLIPKKERLLGVYNLMTVHASWADYELCLPHLQELVDNGFDIMKYMKKPKPGMVVYRSPKQIEVMLKREYQRMLRKKNRIRRVLVSTPDQSKPLLKEPIGKQLLLVGYAIKNPDLDIADALGIEMKEGADGTFRGLVRRVSITLVTFSLLAYLSITQLPPYIFPEKYVPF